MKTTKNIALIKFVLLLFLGLGLVPIHVTTTLNASQTALRFEPLANVIHLSDDAAIAGTTYTKLGTIEDVYVIENNLNQLKYIFDAKKLGNTNIKTKFKELFIAKADDMFTNLGQAKMNQLFKLENMNNITNSSQFIDLLNNNPSFLDNALKFIKVE